MIWAQPPTTVASTEGKVGSGEIETEKVDAYLATPFIQLAMSLEQQGRVEAAVACRRWPPPRRPDAITTYFSSMPLSAVPAELLEQGVAEAFKAARKEAARRAFRGAIRSAEVKNSELALELLWRAIREDPADGRVRRLLGLPSGNTARVSVRPGREAPVVLGWPPRSFLVAQSQHFRIYSTAPKHKTTELAENLERFFEVWSQVFFQQWTTSEQLCSRISQQQPIGLPKSTYDVVLFGDREAYVRAFGAETSAAQQSTGYYSPEKKLTLLFDGPGADPETRYHEVTHQLLQQASPNVVAAPGEQAGFWIVEGIASYMESIWFDDSFATIGGWQSPRLQYSRARLLPTKQAPDLEAIIKLGREPFQANEKLAALYSTIASYTHMLMENQQSRTLLQQYLKSVYQGREQPEHLLGRFADKPSAGQLIAFLQLSPDISRPVLRPEHKLDVLCLGRTQASPPWLSQLSPQAGLTWLDLSHLDVRSSDVVRLLGGGTQLRRLSLEATKIDDGIGTTLNSQQRLEELDLSFTEISDETISQLRTLDSLETLWLVGCPLTDTSISTLKSLRSLKMLDVQRTSITDAGLEELKISNPRLQLNPLQLR